LYEKSEDSFEFLEDETHKLLSVLRKTLIWSAHITRDYLSERIFFSLGVILANLSPTLFTETVKLKHLKRFAFVIFLFGFNCIVLVQLYIQHIFTIVHIFILLSIIAHWRKAFAAGDTAPLGKFWGPRLVLRVLVRVEEKRIVFWNTLIFHHLIYLDHFFEIFRHFFCLFIFFFIRLLKPILSFN
jgi:hypothetical protein